MRLSVALLLLAFALPSPGHEGKDQPKTAQTSYSGKASADGKGQTPALPQVSTTAQTDDEGRNKKSDAAPEPKPLMSNAEWVMSGLTFVYVLLTGVYVSYSAKTLRDIATRQQLDISQQIAEATTLNAKARISSERSWIIVSPERTVHQVWTFDLRAVNHGNSPAEILWVFQDELVVEFGEDPPDEPYYGPDVVFTHRQWIPCGDGFYVQKLKANLPRRDDPAEFAALQANEKWLWVYGIIRYRDGLSRDVHETRFCYLVNFQTGPLMSGPPGYNDCT